MWFSPLKGAHLTLGQLDKTLPVNTTVETNKKIDRGIFVYVDAGADGNAKPCFSLYTSTQAGNDTPVIPYIALQSWKDFQAGMAGNIGQAPIAKGIAQFHTKAGSGAWEDGTPSGANEAAFIDAHNLTEAPYMGQEVEGPKITAISILQAAEYQTNAFDQSTDVTYKVGDLLTINNEGKLTPWSEGKCVVGSVTAAPFSRWINDLGASEDGARISGGNSKVINFATMWIPGTGSSAANNGGEPANPVTGQAVNKPVQAVNKPVQAANKPEQAAK